ncbi:hypothetical protein ACC721_06680 [Rhizobium ruizarguesonis]|uniref:Uncharacterized protein n=2 Tax=Rhizobium TaxID=379 RepID=C6AVP8_RHILS|nr:MULTISPECIES: hypothetical protein [Rhizobium]ACS55859.1 hypothetical protein Rleg_1570 [Rhizobium leguminosarum bv. trifolii WSM1325]NEI06151.1 hypothetical protein [Rhizobium ruizarguesonis]NEI50083.1 hypothetical protein [Rhizobium ruizarguesonis]TAU31117.1 hypothetical protein ELI47_08450 [Rhizobium ruizarguesonis]
MGDVKFWSLGVAALSLFLAVVSTVFAYKANQYSKASMSRSLATDFALEASRNPTSNECISFANQLGPDSYGALFQEHDNAFAYVENAATAALQRCLSVVPSGANKLTLDEARKARASIFSKLNAYDDIFESLEAGTALPELLCDDVASFHDANAKTFVDRAESTRPAPFQVQNFSSEYKSLVTAQKENVCGR